MTRAKSQQESTEQTEKFRSVSSVISCSKSGLVLAFALLCLTGCTVRGGWPRFLRHGEAPGWDGPKPDAAVSSAPAPLAVAQPPLPPQIKSLAVISITDTNELPPEDFYRQTNVVWNLRAPATWTNPALTHMSIIETDDLSLPKSKWPEMITFTNKRPGLAFRHQAIPNDGNHFYALKYW